MNGRVKDVPEQVKALSHRDPHIVALQDVRAAAVSRYEMAFTQIGLLHIAHTFQDSLETTPTGVLIASRFELDRLPTLPSEVLWPEGLRSPDREKVIRHWTRRTLFVALQCSWGKINLHNAYITPTNHKEKTSDGVIDYPSIKLDLLSGIYHALSFPSVRPRVLCGDFNTPQEEKRTGEIITWGYKKRGGIYRLAKPDKDTIERRILQGLAVYELYDVYRRFHGYENCGSEEACSWRKYRYDHIFASQTLYPQSICYLQDIRRLQLSDHVPVEVVFELNKTTEANGG